MKMTAEIEVQMLAPCGMNCAVCYAHLRKKKACLGCHGQEQSQPEHCKKCSLKACAQSRGVGFCYECSDFPCAPIKRLDRSYRQRYQVSLIENALRLKEFGAQQYLLEEKIKWTCPDCGGAVCLHDKICSECGKVVFKI
jgi:hypothetical protein